MRIQSSLWLWLWPYSKVCSRKNTFPSSLLWFLAGLSSLWAVGLKAPVLGWLLATGLPQCSLPCTPSHKELTTWQLAFLKGAQAQAPHCGDFSCCRAQALGHVGFSSCGSQASKQRLNSRGAQAQLLHGTWDLPRPGMESVSAALAGGFFTTEPPGKPS